MKKPILVVMAAGMGSRYGGLKQIDPVGKNGEIIMDFSVYDAIEAGFSKVVFVIKKELLNDFKEVIGEKMSEKIKVEYAFQSLEDLPQGFSVPQGRVKPFGTGQAVLAAKPFIDAPFAVINADDFYGRQGFLEIANFFKTEKKSDKMQFAMVGFMLKNTLSENGHVARGVCSIDQDSKLITITERTRVERLDSGDIAFTEDDGKTWNNLSENTPVSMNLWGFEECMIDEIEAGFAKFLKEEMPKNPLKAEFFLPFFVNDLLAEGKAEVSVLYSHDKWYGVTYKEDKDTVSTEISKMFEKGVYKSPLWS